MVVVAVVAMVVVVAMAVVTVVVAMAVVTVVVGSDASAMEMGERLGEASAMEDDV